MTPVAAPQYLTGIDVGRATCTCALLRADKTPVGKPTTFANTAPGFARLTAKLDALGVPAEQILLGMEATGLYWENLYYYLQARGYRLLLLHPAPSAAMTCARCMSRTSRSLPIGKWCACIPA